jgi:hypothetical protein
MSQLLPIAALGVAIFLGMFAAENVVAMSQKRWRFSIRGLMLFTVLVSIALMVALKVMRI